MDQQGMQASFARKLTAAGVSIALGAALLVGTGINPASSSDPDPCPNADLPITAAGTVTCKVPDGVQTMAALLVGAGGAGGRSGPGGTVPDSYGGAGGSSALGVGGFDVSNLSTLGVVTGAGGAPGTLMPPHFPQ